MAIDQIFEGKHLKRGMWVNIIIYLSFYKVYVDNILERYPDLPGIEYQLTRFGFCE